MKCTGFFLKKHTYCKNYICEEFGNRREDRLEKKLRKYLKTKEV